MMPRIQKWTLHIAPGALGWKRVGSESEREIGRGWDREEERLLKDWLRSSRKGQ